MAHDHSGTETCIYCSIKHLGAAKVKIGEAMASADPERRQTRLLDAMAEMNEAETSHLSEYPEMAAKVRKVRKKLEEVAFGFSKEKVGQADVTPLIDDLLALERKDHTAGSRPSSYPPDEEFEKVLTPTSRNVLKAVEHYKGEYGAPASLSDIQFILSIPHGSKLDKSIDKAFAKVPMEEIKAAVKDLEEDGKIERAPGGGYLSAAQAFNIPEANNDMKMLKGSDVGLIVGSELAGKGTDKLATWADQTYGLSTQPLHNRVSTWLPIVGAVLVVAAAKTKYFKQEKHKEAALAATVYGAHLLSQGVDVVEQATTPGVTFGLAPVFVPRSVPQPGLSPAPTPGYLSMASGVGGLRDIF